MTDKQIAEIICRALLAIVAAIRKKYDLPEYKNITIEIHDSDTITPIPEYDVSHNDSYQKHKG